MKNDILGFIDTNWEPILSKILFPLGTETEVLDPQCGMARRIELCYKMLGVSEQEMNNYTRKTLPFYNDHISLRHHVSDYHLSLY